MTTLLDRLSVWNKNMNDVPRRLGLILTVCIIAFIAIKLLPFCWPFVMGLLFAMLMEPLAKLIRKGLGRVKYARAGATLICMLVLYGIITLLVILLSAKLIKEGGSMLRSLPDLLKELYAGITVWLNDLAVKYSEVISVDTMTQIQNALKNAVSSISSWAVSTSGRVAGLTLAKVTSIPYAILAVVFTIMSSFYISYDKERILSFFRNLFPKHVVHNANLIKGGVFTALFGQIKAQCFISFVVTLVVIAGLTITGRAYPLLIGILIGLADVLPVIGAGLFLNPWAVVLLALGEYTAGIGMFITYIAVVTVRQIIEPRIVGKQLGLYPLVTMMSMFAGFKIFGATGLIIGPIVANMCRVTLDADAGVLEERKNDKTTLKMIFKKLFAKTKKG